MKLKILSISLLLCLIVTSCIEDEAANTEADIESCSVPGDILKRDPQIENNRVILTPKDDTDITNLALEFTLTPGATIDPPSGTSRDFTTYQTYVVTSEDRQWEKTYEIFFNPTDLQTLYSFEHVEEVPAGLYRYYGFYEEINEEKQYIWSSGNAALGIILGSGGLNAYPTVSYEPGVSGKCVKLETKSTGRLGSIMRMPLAAGNLFLGEFIVGSAMSDPLGATRFGTPINKEPVSLTGYYKYKAGEQYMDGNDEVDKEDTFDIYAILYETDEDVKYLDGRNSLTSPNLIAIARIADENKMESDNWIYIDIPFVSQPGKEIDLYKLMANKYNISLVFSSSIDGAEFKGAAGSTLIIDEFEIHCK